MQTLIALHLQNPALVWLAAAALFVSASLASGVGRLIQPALAAALVAGACALGIRLGLAGEGAVFVGASVLLIAAGMVLQRADAAGAAAAAPPRAEPPLPFVRKTPAPSPAAVEEPDAGAQAPPRRAARL
jgi:hypothetical protein